MNELDFDFAEQLEQLEFEHRSLGMSIDQARAKIQADPSFQCETGTEYILKQLATVQELFQTSRDIEAQQCLNRLRMALVENLQVNKI